MRASPETLVSGFAVFYFFGSVINMCSYLHSMVKIRTFLQFLPSMGSTVGAFIGYFLGGSRNEALTISYGTAISF